jgi:hypothetical protein
MTKTTEGPASGWWIECKFAPGTSGYEEDGGDWGLYMSAKDKTDALGQCRFERSEEDKDGVPRHLRTKFRARLQA